MRICLNLFLDRYRIFYTKTESINGYTPNCAYCLDCAFAGSISVHVFSLGVNRTFWTQHCREHRALQSTLTHTLTYQVVVVVVVVTPFVSYFQLASGSFSVITRPVI